MPCRNPAVADHFSREKVKFAIYLTLERATAPRGDVRLLDVHPRRHRQLGEALALRAFPLRFTIASTSRALPGGRIGSLLYIYICYIQISPVQAAVQINAATCGAMWPQKAADGAEQNQAGRQHGFFAVSRQSMR